MRAFGIVGDGATALRDRLVESFDDADRAATVSSAASDGTPPDGVATTCRVGDSGVTVTRREDDLVDVLDRLAGDHEYAIVLDHPGAALPHVTIGDTPYEGAVLAAVDEAGHADLEAIRREVDAIEPHGTLESLVAAAERTPDADRAGAIATFTGRVRTRDDPDDDPTEFLEFEKYDAVADERMATIESELEDREGVYEVRLHHRTGVVEAGEHIVFVVVLAGHRAEAFETVEDGIDRLKAEVPLFKREVTTDDSFWVHDRS